MSKGRHKPIRMCIVCRNRFYKGDLIRLSLINGKITIDKTHSLGGRGAYSCHNCIDRAIRDYKNCLNKAFRYEGSQKITLGDDITDGKGKNS